MKVIKVEDKVGMKTPAVCHGCQGEYPIVCGPREWRTDVVVHDGKRLRTLVYCQRCSWFLRELTKARFSERDYEAGRMKWRMLPNQLRNRWLEYMADVREDALDGFVEDSIPLVQEVYDGKPTGRFRPMNPAELAEFRKQNTRIKCLGNRK